MYEYIYNVCVYICIRVCACVCLNHYNQSLPESVHRSILLHYIKVSITLYAQQHLLFLTSTFDKQKVYHLSFHLAIHKY